MRQATAIILIICLCSSAFAGKASGKSQFAKLEKTQFGKNLLSAISLHARSGEPVQNILDLLDEIEVQLHEDQEAADVLHADFQDSCSTNLESIAAELAVATEAIQEAQEDLDIAIPRYQTLSDDAERLEEEIEDLNDDMIELYNIREEEANDYAEAIQEIEDALAVFTNARQVFDRLAEDNVPESVWEEEEEAEEDEAEEDDEDEDDYDAADEIGDGEEDEDVDEDEEEELEAYYAGEDEEEEDDDEEDEDEDEEEDVFEQFAEDDEEEDYEERLEAEEDEEIEEDEEVESFEEDEEEEEIEEMEDEEEEIEEEEDYEERLEAEEDEEIEEDEEVESFEEDEEEEEIEEMEDEEEEIEEEEDEDEDEELELELEDEDEDEDFEYVQVRSRKLGVAKGQSSLAQVSSALKKVTLRSRGTAAIARLFAQITSRDNILANQQMVVRILGLFDVMAERLNEQAVNERNAEEIRIDVYNSQVSTLRANQAELQAQLDNTNYELQSLDNRIQYAQAKLEENQRTADEKTEQYNDVQAECQDENANYERATEDRATELNVVAETRNIVQGKLEGLLNYVEDRVADELDEE